jgi:hypothetical protein
MRDFKPGDQVPVRELVLEGMRERWGDAYDPSVNPDLDDISASYLDRGAPFACSRSTTQYQP